MNQMMEMKFSILHPTVRPNQSKNIKLEYIKKARNLNDFEYIFATDYKIPDVLLDEVAFSEPYRLGMVNKLNLAARYSRGEILICATDDVYPCQDWDVLISEAIGDMKQAAWLACDDGVARKSRPDLLHSIILTRPYYNRYGWILHPRLYHLYSDDFMTALAKRDGVIKKAPHILMDHRHPFYGKGSMDEHYQRAQGAQQYAQGRAIFDEIMAEYRLEKNTEPIL